MSMPKELTREELIRLGVSNVTEEGRIFVNGYERSLSIISKKHKYGKECKYKVLGLYDSELYKRQVESKKKTCNGIRMIIVSRIIWAWFNGVTPGYMDVDHINSNSLDNRLDNLQLLTRKENLAKRTGHKNMYTTEKWINEHKENK